MPRLMTRIHGIPVLTYTGTAYGDMWQVFTPETVLPETADTLEEAAGVIIEALSRNSVTHYVADIDAETIRTECGNVDHFDSLCNVINAVTCKDCRQEYADRMVAEFQAQCDC